jgi:predicted metal-dependent phosphoesterase TrpH
VADLHLHTTASDGEYSISQIMVHAQRVGLHAIALTDHDVITPPDRIVAGLEVLAGVEVSSVWKEKEVHILGLGVDPACISLQVALQNVRVSREQRFREYLAAVQTAGLAIPADWLANFLKPIQSLGRRHVALLMMQLGFARTYSEAWRGFVAPHGNQVSPKALISAETTLDLIHQAGGLAILAHPDEPLTKEQLAEWKSLRLDGVEVRFPVARAERTRDLIRIAQDLDLLISGGSDCHGPGNPARLPGGTGINLGEWQRLKAALTR